MTIRLCFPRNHRLRQPQEFKQCFEQGVRANGRLFRMHYLPGAESPRLGLAVSRKVDTLAVVRNRIKRAARECFRHHCHVLPRGDFVLVAKREAAAATSAELRLDLETLWRKSATLKPTIGAGTMRDAVDVRTPARDA